MPMTPEEVERWRTSLPEEYRDDPQKFRDHYDSMHRERDEYKRFYDEEYAPWYNQHGQAYQDYQRHAADYNAWRQGQQGTPDTPAPASQPRQPTALPQFDYDAPDVVERVVEWAQNRFAMTDQTIDNRATEFYKIMTLREQAHQIKDQDLYDHLQYTPRANIGEVVRYANARHIQDLTTAADQLYGPERRRAELEQARQDARKELEQEYQRRLTTEMTTGTPIPMSRRSAQVERGYGSRGRDDILNQVYQRREARRLRSVA